MDALAGRLHKQLEGHSDAILELAYSPDGSKLLSATGDPCIVVWDTSSGTQLDRVSSHADAVADIVWRDDSTFASSSFDREIHVTQMRRQVEGAGWMSQRLRVLRGHQDEVLLVDWAPNKWLLASCADRHAKLWSVHQVRGLPHSSSAVTAARAVQRANEQAASRCTLWC